MSGTAARSAVTPKRAREPAGDEEPEQTTVMFATANRCGRTRASALALLGERDLDDSQLSK